MSLLAAPKPRAKPQAKAQAKAKQNDAEECVFGIGGVAAAATSLFTLQFGPFAGTAMTDEALRAADRNKDGTLDRFEQEGVSVDKRLVVRFDAKSGRNVVDVATSDAIEESKSESPALPTVEPSYFKVEDGERQYVWDQRVRKFKERKEALFGLLYAPSVLVVGLIASMNRLTKKVKTLRKVSPRVVSRLQQKLRTDKAFVVDAIEELLKQLKEQQVTKETLDDLRKFFGAYRDVGDEFDDDLAGELAAELRDLEVLRNKLRAQNMSIERKKMDDNSSVEFSDALADKLADMMVEQLQQKNEEIKELEEEVDRLTEELDG